MKYPELKGKCKNCGGCMRLEDVLFTGSYDCKYADEPIKEIKKILGIQEMIKNE